MTDNPSIDQKNQSVETQTNIVHADKVIIRPSGSAATPLVPQQIRRPPLDFKGREDEIRDIIEKFDCGATVIGVRGLGGIGKTALALVLGDRLKDRFPDGQLFLDMQGMSKSPLKPDDAMAHIIRSYRGADATLPVDLNGLAGLYHSVLSGKRAMILLDNAASREQVEPLLPPAGSAVLITSRNKFVLPGLKEMDLDVLPLEDARKLLLEINGRIGEHAGELAELCGCLPLALRNAAYALKEKPNLSVANYIKKLGDARKRLELVDASFSLSYDLLTQELQRLWCLLSVFPADFDLLGAAAVWEMNQESSEGVLGDLMKWSLVDYLSSASGEGGRYRLHDLARDFTDSRLEADARENARQRHAKHYQELLRKANELFRQGGDSLSNGLIQFDADWMNIQIGQKWTKINAAKSFEIAQICSGFSLAGSILNLRLHPRENIDWLRAALAAARQLKNRRAKGAHLCGLGIAYDRLGAARKAIKFYRLALSIAREIKDIDGERDVLNNLGCAYFHLIDFPKSIEYFEQVLAMDRMNHDRREEGADLGNLGSAYYALDHQEEKAIEYYAQSLEISRERGDKQIEGNALFNMCICWDKLGQRTKAIDLARSALKVFEEIKSPDVKDVQNILELWHREMQNTNAI